MQGIRQPDFAGSWYPATQAECQQICQRLDRESPEKASLSPLRGGIVPHAGWVFSGRIAFLVVRELAQQATADTVVLFGGHLHPASATTILHAAEFWTPLGPLPLDTDLTQRLTDQHGLEVESAQRHTPDNTVELQVPFIRHFFPDCRLVVIGAPPCPSTLKLAQSVAQTGEDLGRRLVVLGSTDLTHYGPNYGWMPQGRGPEALRWVKEDNDRRYIDLALGLDPEATMEEALDRSNACCPGAAAAALAVAKNLGAQRAELLAYGTSADVRPDDSFVGYAGIVF